MLNITDDQVVKVLKFIDDLDATVEIDWWSGFAINKQPLNLREFKTNKNILWFAANYNHDWGDIEPYKIYYRCWGPDPQDGYIVTVEFKKVGDDSSTRFRDIGIAMDLETIKKYCEHHPEYHRHV